MKQLLDRFLLLQPVWLPTLLFIPLLYALGWITAVPLTLLGLPAHQVSLTGTVLSFVLFLLVMPRWAALRWSEHQPWRRLGLVGRNPRNRIPHVTSLCIGLLMSVALITLIVGLLVFTGRGTWQGNLTINAVLNCLLLTLGVGLAEELIFRGWLWEELTLIIGATGGMLGQAALFSLVHTRFNLGILPMLGLLTGLFLLGLVLALLRYRNHGSLWGSIGLHGGLVGAWFLVHQNLLTITPSAPMWLVGPGGSNANPLGGVVAILSLTAIAVYLLQHTERMQFYHPKNSAYN
ncbi:CPBP family intramembrane metalloprotease [Synechococcus sp. HB1133]|uniref:CPBP family intramembrane glutamic endopeptidase n=2 Tax=Synechococcus TaxID=1129 RepID=UPI00140C18D4|nr:MULTISPECIES: CPBP family intramembrane glutamic endopeptidase [unclassified Synechococcus]MCB4394322.1 CPBP family intramembrane metalloprotease [Synechococcus sp. PH41509]MCB4422945.1 CPBP family intramembrane metalloprotease [Synechococcus sp. HB1133]MCB4431585.1 CPBP family intramembrane metalloprotease [Synechococcus sp. HBA1120]NHI81893.1 CPBP family intramembrane metalloprotease [Synechococcus sp. HB1133]